MSSRDRKTRASFRTLNQPANPEPEFAARLRTRLLTGTEPELRPARVTPFDQPSGAAPASRKRTRWLDIAAVAALFLGMVGGMAGLTTSTGGDATPTIQAPTIAEPPVTWNGTAAGGRLFPGPAPVSGDYELRWSAEEGLNGLVWPVIPAGDLIYGFSPHSGELAQQTVRALDAGAGALVWEAEAVNQLGFAVTSRGVVVAVPIVDRAALGEGASTATFQVALLDRDSGEPNWISARGYASGQLANSHLIVDETTIYFATGEGVVVAIDLETGAERWRYAYDRICKESVPRSVSCAERDQYMVKIATAGDTLYISDPATAMVKALTTADGRERWTVPVADRAGLLWIPDALIAVEAGVVVQVRGSSSNATETLSYLGLWSAETGAEEWRTLERVAAVISTGISLFVSTMSPEGGCCGLAELDPSSGETVRSRSSVRGAVYSYLAASDTIITFRIDNTERRDPGDMFQFTSWAGLDATTWEEVWRFEPPDMNCLLLLPVLNDGNVVCQHNDDRIGMSVYGPARSEPQASPTPAASPAVEGQPDTTHELAAQDGQRAGQFPSADATFKLLWEEQEPQGDSSTSLVLQIVGDVVYRAGGSENDLSAYSLQTGEELWRTEAYEEFGYALTGAGIVIALLENPDAIGTPRAFAVTLLDHHTGQPIWQTGMIYEHDRSPRSSVLVSGDAIYLVDDAMTVVAMDLATGSELWRYDAAHGRSKEEMVSECRATSTICVDRAFHSSRVALGKDKLYLFAPLPGEVVALALADGSRTWSVNISERTGLFSAEFRLIVTDSGLIVQATNERLTSFVNNATNYLSLWSPTDGAELWSQPLAYSYAVSTGASLLISIVDETEDGYLVCCTLTTIDVKTGEVIDEQFLEDAHIGMYYPQSDTAVLGHVSSQTFVSEIPIQELLVLNATTDPTDAIQFLSECARIIPSLDGAHIVCQRPDGSMAAYEVNEGVATPSP